MLLQIAILRQDTGTVKPGTTTYYLLPLQDVLPVVEYEFYSISTT